MKDGAFVKKLRRLITNPKTGELKMTTLYEYHAKVGTGASTIIWLLSKAKKGDHVYGFWEEEHYSPYMKGHAFRYAPAERFCITDIQHREDCEFLIVSKV